MSAVEDRIVAMKFDNKQFDPNVKSSMGMLDRLKAALNLKGAGKGLTDLQNTASRFSLAGLTNGVQAVGAKFSVMSAVALAAIGTIVARAVSAGIQVAKAFTLDPLKQGFSEYEATLGSTQTIMSGTGESVEKVTASLQRLNDYSDKTIYSFSDMTKNISMFTNAGLSSAKATDVMIGISNAAAAAGISADKAANAMFGFGQSMSVGYVQLQDWNQIDQAGIATKEFKNELIDAGLAAGTLTKSNNGVIKTNKGTEVTFKNLRNTLQDQWLTSDVLTNTLNKYSDAQTDVGQKAAKNAQNVYKFTQLMDVTKESVGSGWSQTFQNLFGNLKEASGLFSAINIALNGPSGFISNNSNARNAMLKTWKEMGGREAILDGLKTAFNALVAIVKPINAAFRQIFPATTGKQLYELSERFFEFTQNLKIGADTAKNIQRTFAGLFAVLHIGVQFISALLNVFGRLIGAIAGGSGNFLEFTGSIGDFLVWLDKAIASGDVFNKFFEKLGDVVSRPIQSIKDLTASIGQFFKDLFSNPLDTVNKSFGRLGERLAPLGKLGPVIAKALGAIFKVLGGVGAALMPFFQTIGDAFGRLNDVIANAIKTGDFSPAFDALNTGLLAGLVLVVRNFLKNGFKIDFGGGLVKDIKETFGALTDTLGAMQSQIKAGTLLKIAGAVALLTASIVALSLIDSKKLTKAMTAIGVAFGQLLGAMAILDKISGTAGFIKTPAIAASMILLSTAVLILTGAVKNLSDLDWNELAKGLTGVGVILGLMVATSRGLDKASGPLIRAGLAMIPFAVGLKILASAVKDFTEMNWGDMVRGIAGMFGSLGGIALALRLMPKNMPATSLQIIALAAAMKILASALQDFSDISWEEMARGITAMAGALGVISLALRLMPADTGSKAVGLVILAAALKIMASALQDMGGMSWDEIGRGLTTLAAAMGIMVVALNLMSGTLSGSAALVLAAGALALLVPVIATLGSLPLATLAIGLGAIAAVFVILGVAGAALASVSPVIALLAVAILALGAAVALTGVGLLAMATAFSVFVAAASVGGAALLTLINLIPAFMAKFAEGIGAFIVSLAAQQGRIIQAGVELVGGLLKAVVLIVPQLSIAMNALVGALINIVLQNVPRLADAGLKLIIALLTALRNNIGQLVAVGAQVVVKFLNGIANNLDNIVNAAVNLMVKFIQAIQKQQGKLLDAGAKLIISFVNRLASTIRSNQSAMNTAGRRLASAIASGMTGGLTDAISGVVTAAVNLAKSAYNAAKDALDINSPSRKFRSLGLSSGEGMEQGLNRSEAGVSAAGGRLMGSALTGAQSVISTIKESMQGLGDFNPVITPSLDLSGAISESKRIGNLFKDEVLKTSSSYDKASSLADRLAPVVTDIPVAQAPAAPAQPVQFIQNITAPSEIPAGRIYMDTKSLLSMKRDK